MTFWNKSPFKLPVGLVNDLNPLGHSGHRKLQAVVGSMERVMGRPFIAGLFFHFDW
jgi:hypothetical protein